ncbi:hypothetical protein DPMN_051865 [Dreissena polymorpha]|uniref:Uncharacterized protein n=1 Tax=Dreissena polymorpha TaxID=45954 RepID=A0A9D4HPC8_DREPO|nr:hypothetical protein DPMN_051865 [Dreissena polymorpha]
MARMVDNITVPMARASILWLIGEYSDRVPKIAPDTFIQEQQNGATKSNKKVQQKGATKRSQLQILNLGAKLVITNSKQTKLLCQYVFNLAKYDQNYDIRDRSRFLRQLLGTLSHMINSRATGYQQLPEWPEVAPDPAVRNVEKTPLTKKGKPKKEKAFYSSSETSGADDEDSDDEEDSGDDSDEDKTGSESESDSDSEDTEEDSSDDVTDSSEDSDDKSTPQKKPTQKVAVTRPAVKSNSVTEDSDDESSEESTSESEPEVKKKPKQGLPKAATPSAQMLLNKLSGDGLGITYKFTRTISIFTPKMVSIELTFTNSSERQKLVYG